MWFHLETAASKDTDVWREGKHLPRSDEHSSDSTRGTMEHSWSIPYSIGSKRTTTSKSATKLVCDGAWLQSKGRGGGGGSPGVPASARSVGQAGAAEHSLFFHWAKLLLDVMLN